VVDPNLPTKFNQKVRNLMYYQVFAFFWVSSFISAVFQMTVAGAVAQWYFSRDANGANPTTGSPAFKTLGWALTKSFGSLAFGSLVLAILKFINFMLEKAKTVNAKNKVALCLLSCIQCFFRCIEKFVKWMDKFAYISMAMHGESFLGSAKSSFNLISRNMFSAVVVDTLGSFVLFVGKLLGTATCTLFTMGIAHEVGRPISGVTVAVVVVISYCVFDLFSHVVGVGVDTVFICYIEDMERNKDGAMYASEDLSKAIKEKAAKVHSKGAINNA